MAENCFYFYKNAKTTAADKEEDVHSEGDLSRNVLDLLLMNIHGAPAADAVLAVGQLLRAL